MIEHKLFTLPKKPNKLDFINIKVIDEEELLKIKSKTRNVVDQALMCLNSKQFIDGMYFGSIIFDKFKNGLFSKIEVKSKNDLIVCKYYKNNIEKEEILDSTVKLEQIIEILKSAGYLVEVKIKEKI